MSVVVIAGAFIVKILANNLVVSHDEHLRLKNFYAAEAGIEWAKSKLSTNPDWFTDPPHSPADDSDWIISSASGHQMTVGGSKVKVIREDQRGRVYSVGGSSLIIKIEFTTEPFELLSWKNI